ncbi:flavodoxin domain-containing protein [Streptomyces gardneri]|nr:flavodoxin domain-containing protein [Streptomyces gardneri]
MTVNTSELNEFSMDRLARASPTIIVTSTYNEGGNEGDMPDNAALFWRALAADSAPRLDGLRFAVLALGDRGYFDFCHAGVLIDERLEQLGAQRIAVRVDCDAIYEEDAEAWTSDTVATLATQYAASASGDTSPDVVETSGQIWTRRNPFDARILESRKLTRDGSTKEVRHYTLDLSGSEIAYTAGDSISVQPVNDPELVGALIERLKLQPGDSIDGTRCKTV